MIVSCIGLHGFFYEFQAFLNATMRPIVCTLSHTLTNIHRLSTHHAMYSLAWMVAGRNTLGGGSLCTGQINGSSAPFLLSQ